MASTPRTVPPAVAVPFSLALKGAVEVARLPLAAARLPLRLLGTALGVAGQLRGQSAANSRSPFDDVEDEGGAPFASADAEAMRGPGKADAGRAAAPRAASRPAPPLRPVPDPVEELPEQLAAAVADVTPGGELEHDALPLPDYDHLTLGSLRGRLRTLDAVALVQLRDYEKTHANRLPVMTMLENRLTKLAGESAEPSGGSPEPAAVETPPAPAGDTEASPQTAGPAQNPPSHGVPTNPAQPR